MVDTSGLDLVSRTGPQPTLKPLARRSTGRSPASSYPVISFHDLRHTHATLLLRAGVPVKVVSERLGHANPAFTLTVYQHVIPGMQEEAATLFAELIFGPGEPAGVPAP